MERGMKVGLERGDSLKADETKTKKERGSGGGQEGEQIENPLNSPHCKCEDVVFEILLLINKLSLISI